MQFASITLGDPDLIFPENVSVTRDFAFAQPVTSARAVLQGFDLAYDDPDHELRSVAVNLVTHFGSGDKAGTVEISFSLRDDSTFRIISGQVRVLVIGL